MRRQRADDSQCVPLLPYNWLTRVAGSDRVNRSPTLSPDGLLDGRLNFQACLDVPPVLCLFDTLAKGGDVVGPSQFLPERLCVHFFFLSLAILPKGECAKRRHEQHPQDNPSSHASPSFRANNSVIETFNVVHHTKLITASCLAMSSVDGE